MAVLLVTYEKTNLGHDYDPLYWYLMQHVSCQISEHAWLVETSISSIQVGEVLRPLVDVNDLVLIAQVTRNWVCHKDRVSNWLRDPSRDW